MESVVGTSGSCCRGFVGNSMWKMCKILGITGNIRKTLMNNVIHEKEHQAGYG